MIPELFARQVAAGPDRTAVRSGGDELTYRELDERAERLAVRLRGSGVRGETPVGVLLDRSADFVVAVLAILKAGGAYVPLSPGDPVPRLAHMLAVTTARIVVTHGALAGRLPVSVAAVHVDDQPTPATASVPPAPAPAHRAHPDSLAYVMFTSGSTGAPKGVMVTHRGIARLVREPAVRPTETDVVLLHSAPGFDASTLEIWGTLLNGATLVVGPPHTPSPAELGRLLRATGVTVLWLTAGLFHLMVDECLDGLRGLRLLVAGGDVLSAPRVGRAARELAGCRVVNGYGPTENTTFTTCFPVPHGWAERGAVPIGRPITGTRVLILDELDEGLRQVPVGRPGQLCAGGAGLARGYLGDPALTAERFLPDPSGDGARLYATGDLARMRPDDTIEFLGRLDDQVKVRGFRVTPGEIERVLREYPDVHDAAVAPYGNTPENRRLAAYLVFEPASAAKPSEVRDWLRDRLPGHLIPDLWTTLDVLPLTPIGKIDRNALPVPSCAAGLLTEDAPVGEDEGVIAGIWRQVLSVEHVGRHDDFFDLGGHSLLAARMVSRVRRALGVELALSAVFDHPTIAELTRLIRGD